MATISLGPFSRTASNDLPEDLSAGRAILLFGLPPGGVCRAAAVARGAVSSYLTVSPLPSPVARPSGGLISVALSLFLRTVGVAHHPALGSPDFPPATDVAGGRPRTKRGGAYERRRERQATVRTAAVAARGTAAPDGDTKFVARLVGRTGAARFGSLARWPSPPPAPRFAPRLSPCAFPPVSPARCSPQRSPWLPHFVRRSCPSPRSVRTRWPLRRVRRW